MEIKGNSKDCYWTNDKIDIYNHIDDLERLWDNHGNDFELVKKWMVLPITEALSMLMEADELMTRMCNRIEYLRTTKVAFFLIGRLVDMQHQCKCLKKFIDETRNSLNYKKEEKQKYYTYTREIPYERPVTLFDGIIPDNFDLGRGFYKPMGIDSYASVIGTITSCAHELYIILERLTSYVSDEKQSVEEFTTVERIMEDIETFKQSDLYSRKRKELLDRIPQSVMCDGRKACMKWLEQNELLRCYLDSIKGLDPEMETSYSVIIMTAEIKRRNAIVLKAISEGIDCWVKFLSSLSLYYEFENGLCIAEIPEVLNNPKALSLLKKAQMAGMLDNQWQPIGDYKTNKRKASVLAFVIGRELNLPTLWPPFETLWKRSNMRNDFDGAKSAKYYSTLEKRIKNLIS